MSTVRLFPSDPDDRGFEELRDELATVCLWRDRVSDVLYRIHADEHSPGPLALCENPCCREAAA